MVEKMSVVKGIEKQFSLKESHVRAGSKNAIILKTTIKI